MSKTNELYELYQRTFSSVLVKEGDEHTPTSEEISLVIDKLYQEKREAQQRENAEKEKKKEQKQKEKRLKELRENKQHIVQVTSMELPLDWENVFAGDTRTEGVHCDNASDGLILCLSNLGRVDIEYIASVTGLDLKNVISKLKGSIYQNPDKWNECFYKGYETADEYLSGNLMRKWKSATKANKKYNNFFADNVKAIEKILPPAVATDDIYITIGSPWVPTDIIDDFMLYLFGDFKTNWYIRSNISDEEFYKNFKVMHDKYTGSWEIPIKTRYDNSSIVNHTYGTKRINALKILEKTLNMNQIVIKDKVKSKTSKSGYKWVLNKNETILAIEKQNLMIEKFKEWVWTDKKRKERLEIIFENNFSCYKQRNFDGSFLKFPNMSPNVSLYSYQKNAVARIIFTPNTLLAHDVGSGKTYVMIAAAMELKRMQLSSKNMFVVPNNIVGQWKGIFKTMYPNANLLCIEPKDFVLSKRENVLENIRDEEHDAIIIAYSCFEQIPISKKYYKKHLEEQEQYISDILTNNNKVTSKLMQKKESISKELKSLFELVDDMYDSIYFDELGITRLFVDEAHNYKNVPISTSIKNVLGINTTGSKKCQDMFDKVMIVQRQNDGKGVVFATGTPITNSISEAYIMQKYLQSGELAILELQNFDSWVGMFAEKETKFEVDVDTNSYRMATRFSKFHNLPELTSLLSSIADFHQVNASDGIPHIDGYSDELISKSKYLKYFLDDISERVERVRLRIEHPHVDNMLKITTDGRKAALDVRLVNNTAKFSYDSKVARCSENVADIYLDTLLSKKTQIIFCDISTPKSTFNIYDELKTLLIGYGVNKEEIAFIHDATTEKKRNELFKKVREGEIRVLIGSTFKLGIGVNVQDKLVAIHHIDVPWRPADMTQREGRILRQGNENSEVKIFRYITKGSFDAYSWQLIETKARFINEILSGNVTQRNGAEISDTVLDYAEVKALAIGNPKIKERFEIANELNKLCLISHKRMEEKNSLSARLTSLPAKIANQKQVIASCEEDLKFYTEFKNSSPQITTNAQKEKLTEYRRSVREKIFSKLKDNILTGKEEKILKYRGFDVILPSNMVKKKPHIWLERAGRYYVELSDTKVGCLIRIDNFLDTLDAHLSEFKATLSKLKKEQVDIQKDLEKDDDLGQKIKELQEKIDKIDDELGVNKNE